MDDLERIERGRDVTAGLDYEESEREWDDDTWLPPLDEGARFDEGHPDSPGVRGDATRG